ncbi:unnamed protein product [Sympodiomycopsis kandeliae]
MTMPTPTTAESSEFSSHIATLLPQSQDLFEASTSALPINLPSTSDISSHDALLKLKSALLLSYTQHLAVLSSHKLLGLSIESDEQGKQLVHNLVTTRLTLEKLRPVEARLKPRYERCIRAYDLEQKKALLQGQGHSEDAVNEQGEEEELDALSFRPNPAALLNSSSSSSKKDSSRHSRGKKASSDQEEDDGESSAGVYKPPKLAPVPYNEEAQRRRKSRRDDGSDDGADSDDGNTRSSRNRRALNAHLLQDMTSSLSSNPYAQSSSGLSRDKSHQSKRARKLQEMEDFEEANFTRLVQSKKEQRKRRRDEEDVALGGVTTAGLGSNKKIGGGFEEEFGDLLRGSERGGKSGNGSRKEWDNLVQKRKKGNSRLDGPSGNGRKGPGTQRRSSGNRFEKAVKSHNRRSG